MPHSLIMCTYVPPNVPHTPPIAPHAYRDHIAHAPHHARTAQRTASHTHRTTGRTCDADRASAFG
ncbi:hypothetical protein, partial [Streptomyces sp. SID1034]|uniref:hypothetical protein n=1 Tax=Streptomyces sp. SID1034 TaxID=2690248 RepID=UPI001F24736F